MTENAGFRDYALASGAPCASFGRAQWHVSPIPRKVLLALMRKSDRKGLADYALWLALLAASGAAAVLAWGSWYAVPAFLVYGVLYASAANSRRHECGHRTPFRSRRLNDGFYLLTSFMALKSPYRWHWSHVRHHTETIIVGRDPEIAFPRPPSFAGLLLNLLYLRVGLGEIAAMARHSLGRLNRQERDYIPVADHRRLARTARLYLAVLAASAASSAATGSWLPLMLVGLPSFYGNWLHHILSVTQHAGLAEDTPDHRRNSRTILLNPVLRFVYSNMNYHIEHHMFPKVPFHALPALHEAVKADMPPPCPGLIAAYREIIPALLRQRRDPGYHLVRGLPPAARPA